MTAPHSQTPEPIPNADDRRVLHAAMHRQLIVTSGGKPVIAGGHCNSPAPIAAYRRCEARRWIQPADHNVAITTAGAAALGDYLSRRTMGSRR